MTVVLGHGSTSLFPLCLVLGIESSSLSLAGWRRPKGQSRYVAAAAAWRTAPPPHSTRSRELNVTSYSRKITEFLFIRGLKNLIPRMSPLHKNRRPRHSTSDGIMTLFRETQLFSSTKWRILLTPTIITFLFRDWKLKLQTINCGVYLRRLLNCYHRKHNGQ